MREHAIQLKYELSSRTFLLIKNKLRKRHSSWGITDYIINDSVENLFLCCGLDPFTFQLRTKRSLFPFYKYFVFLVFTCSSVKEINDILVAKKFVSKHKDSKKWVKETRTALIQKCFPPSLRKYAEKGKKPPKQFEKLWRIIFELLGLNVYIDAPDLIELFDTLFADHPKRVVTEVLLSTEYEEVDIMEALKLYADDGWTEPMLEVYVDQFYNINSMTPADWIDYLRVIPFQDRLPKDRCFGKSLTKMQLERGMVTTESLAKIMQDGVGNLTQRYVESMNKGNTEGLTEALRCLNAIVKLKHETDAILDNDDMYAKFNDITTVVEKEDLSGEFLDDTKDPRLD